MRMEERRAIIFTPTTELIRLVWDMAVRAGHRPSGQRESPHSDIAALRVDPEELNWACDRGTYNEHGEFGTHTYPIRLNAETDMDRIREMFDIDMQITLPDHSFVVYCGDQEELKANVLRLAYDAGWNWAGGSPPSGDLYPCLSFYANGAIRHGGEGDEEFADTRFDATQDWPTIERLFRKKIKGPDRKRFYIITHGQVALSTSVQSLILFPAGCSWGGMALPMYTDRGGLIVIGSSLSFGTEVYCRERASRDKVPVFDAATQWSELCEYMGVGPKAMKAKDIMGANLYEMVRTQHNNEVVLGLIRRDLGIAVSKEVQAAGPDAICKRVEEAYAEMAAAGSPPAPPKPSFHTVEVTVIERRTTRTADSIRVRINIPADVVQRDIEGGYDGDRIFDYIAEHYNSNGTELRRNQSDEQDTGTEYSGLEDDTQVHELLDRLTEE